MDVNYATRYFSGSLGKLTVAQYFALDINKDWKLTRYVDDTMLKNHVNGKIDIEESFRNQ